MASQPLYRQSHDPTFYRTPRDAGAAPTERLAYVAVFSRPADRPDAIAVLDVDASSSTYGKVVGFTELPHLGDEVHHFGWNTCSAALDPRGDHCDSHSARRHLIVPGLRSSRIYVLDISEDPKLPRIVKVITAEEFGKATGYSKPHTVHCGPGAVFVSALGGHNKEGPGGVALLDNNTFSPVEAWEKDRGDQHYAYDIWWHIMADVAVTSEWGTPSMVEDGIIPELLLGKKYGHSLHFWDMKSRSHVQSVDLGDEHQMVLELRPAHNPTKRYGFAGVVISVADLSASVWLWFEEGGKWAAKKIISIPAEPASVDDLPPLLKGFGAVPPLITDLALSVDDRFLYVSCWGTGRMHAYNVTDPFNPVETGTVEIGGIVRRSPHPSRPDLALSGGPQMVEVSRNGKRVFFTNSLYGSWDDQFYPDGVGAWMAVLNVDEAGTIAFDDRFFPEGEAFRGRRTHQIRLEGGDASSDSYCYA